MTHNPWKICKNSLLNKNIFIVFFNGHVLPNLNYMLNGPETDHPRGSLLKNQSPCYPALTSTILDRLSSGRFSNFQNYYFLLFLVSSSYLNNLFQLLSKSYLRIREAKHR